MKDFVPYKLTVEAKYKEYIPLSFQLKVNYYPNLDGKIKILDLGTHVFYKSTGAYMRPKTPYKFDLINVL